MVIILTMSVFHVLCCVSTSMPQCFHAVVVYTKTIYRSMTYYETRRVVLKTLLYGPPNITWPLLQQVVRWIWPAVHYRTYHVNRLHAWLELYKLWQISWWQPSTKTREWTASNLKLFHKVCKTPTKQKKLIQGRSRQRDQRSRLVSKVITMPLTGCITKGIRNTYIYHMRWTRKALWRKIKLAASKT